MAENEPSTYREIPLTQGQVALVDEEDYERIAAHKWYAYKRLICGCISFRAVRCAPKTHSKKPAIILMAREVMNAPPGMEVDHRNHNTLDNRKANLRIATRQQNNRNRRSNKGALKGTHKRPGYEKWQALIRVNGKLLNLGDYSTPELAHAAYLAAATKHFGEFACGE